MGAPATQGRLCLKLAEMEIGDYIRCTYTVPMGNVAGEFTELGGTGETLKELPTIPAMTANGYFYFLKVDKGFLIADRMIQSGVSVQALNLKNYLNGADDGGYLIRCLSEVEWTKYLANGDLNGCILKRDANVWHPASAPITIAGANFAGEYSFATKNIEITATLVDSVNVRTKLNIDDNLISLPFTWPGMGRPPYDANYKNTVHCGWYSTNSGGSNGPARLYVPINIPVNSGASPFIMVNCKVDFKRVYTCFRPSLEYVDNKKSKTIWY